jgi:two-component system sensor kinase FixL
MDTEKDPGLDTTGASYLVPDVQLNSLFDALVEAMIVANERGRIERFNKAAEQLFGYTEAEVMGRNLTILMPPPDRDQHDQYMEHYLETGERRIIGIGREVRARRKDGSIFLAELAVGEVRWKNNVRFVGIMRDVTDRKKAEEQAIRQGVEMIKVSRLMTMGEMAAAMAHELNQPLTAIANYASASRRLLADLPAAGEVLGALDQIDAQAHRAGEVIRRMRSFVRYDDSGREPVQMKTVIDEIRPLLQLDAKANNIRLEIEVAGDLPELVADRIQVQQVILNLVRNGIDAMSDIEPAERVIRLECRADTPDRVLVAVTDHGTGVPEESAARMFQAFYTTKAAGMGMGLAISRSIIEGHGGRLWYENNPGGGATFSFSLPTRVE